MHHAVSGSPVSERKRLLCSGQCYVLEIVTNDWACVVKKNLFYFSDNSKETPGRMRRCCWPLPQQLSVCLCALWLGDDAQGQIEEPVTLRWKTTSLVLLSIHCGHRLPLQTFGFFFSFHTEYFKTVFRPGRRVSHCRQKESRCILIRQRRGLQLIDISVILWSTFFHFYCAVL